jgi:predicted Zn-ribbon and HTH transcriptional regulator
MIEREKVRRLLQDSGSLDSTEKLLKRYKKKNKTDKKYSDIGKALLSMDMLTVTNMNELLCKLNQDDLLYDTKEGAIEYMKNEIKRYNFDLVLDDEDDKKCGYDAYINWNGYRILSGFIEIYEDSKDKWWMGFRYFYIENN